MSCPLQLFSTPPPQVLVSGTGTVPLACCPVSTAHRLWLLQAVLIDLLLLIYKGMGLLS